MLINKIINRFCYIVVRVIDMGNLIRKTKAAISCKEKSTTVVSDVKNDPKKDTAIFVQVSSEELKKKTNRPVSLFNLKWRFLPSPVCPKF